MGLAGINPALHPSQARCTANKSAHQLPFSLPLQVCMRDGDSQNVERLVREVLASRLAHSWAVAVEAAFLCECLHPQP